MYIYNASYNRFAGREINSLRGIFLQGCNLRGLSKWVSKSIENGAAGRLGMIRAAGAT